LLLLLLISTPRSFSAFFGVQIPYVSHSYQFSTLALLFALTMLLQLLLRDAFIALLNFRFIFEIESLSECDSRDN
jgi:hypothetical protein